MFRHAAAAALTMSQQQQQARRHAECHQYTTTVFIDFADAAIFCRRRFRLIAATLLLLLCHFHEGHKRRR